MFPGCSTSVNDVRAVKLVTPDGPLTVQGTDGVHWTLAEKGGYPVEQKQMRDLVLALANLQLLEAKTDDRQAAQAPGAGRARRRAGCEVARAWNCSTTRPARGSRLRWSASPSPASMAAGVAGVYVRRVGDNQAWLAAGELDLPSEAWRC